MCAWEEVMERGRKGMNEYKTRLPNIKEEIKEREREEIKRRERYEQ